MIFHHAVAKVISFYKQVATFLLRSLLFLFVSVESNKHFLKEIIIGRNNNPFNLHMWHLIIMLMIINIILRGENCELGREGLWVGGEGRIIV